ncbi:MAG: hypothetical protein DCC75_13005, partial [Proteobacteria bacterium]
KLADDKLKLFLDLEALNGATLTFEEVNKIILEAFPKSELDSAVLDDCIKTVNSGKKVEQRRIAKGHEPQPGMDGKIVLLVKKFTGQGEVTIDPQGGSHFRDLHLFDNIAREQIVGRVYPPKPGVSGKDAIGSEIPSKPGKPAKLDIDRTLEVKSSDQSEEHYQVIVSKEDGYLAEESGKLSIKGELVIKGNVDFHCGNLDFVGMIRIKGDVLPGFSVKGKRGVSVQGAVREGILMSAEGGIEVSGHVYHGKQGQIVAAKNFSCSVAQEAKAEVIGNITIKKESRDSELRAQGGILISSGSLVGGQGHSACGFEVKLIGNEAGKSTTLVLGSNVEMSLEYSQLILNLESHEKGLKLIDLHLGPYATNQSRVILLKGEFKNKIEKLLEKKKQIESSKLKLLEKKEEILARALFNPSLQVNVLGTMYEGVVIKAGEAIFSCGERFNGPVTVKLDQDKGEFIKGALEPLRYEFQAPSAEQRGISGEENGR